MNKNNTKKNKLKLRNELTLKQKYNYIFYNGVVFLILLPDQFSVQHDTDRRDEKRCLDECERIITSVICVYVFRSLLSVASVTILSFDLSADVISLRSDRPWIIFRISDLQVSSKHTLRSKLLCMFKITHENYLLFRFGEKFPHKLSQLCVLVDFCTFTPGRHCLGLVTMFNPSQGFIALGQRVTISVRFSFFIIFIFCIRLLKYYCKNL